MNRIIGLTLVIIISACGQHTKSNNPKTESENGRNKVNESKIAENQGHEEEPIFSNKSCCEKLELNTPAVIIIQLDSIEIEQLKEVDGEDNFYTAADDLMWYNALMLAKMDSLGTPVKYTDKDTVYVYSENSSWTILKDSTFSMYTYFVFDGKEIRRTELFELIGE